MEREKHIKIVPIRSRMSDNELAQLLKEAYKNSPEQFSPNNLCSGEERDTRTKS